MAQTGAGTAVPGAAICPLPVEIAIREAVPVAATPVAVAVKVTEFKPTDVQVVVLTPAAGPSVQPPSVAMPLEPVNWLAPVIVPPPVTLPHITVTPETGLPLASVAMTHTGPETAAPGAAL